MWKKWYLAEEREALRNKSRLHGQDWLHHVDYGAGEKAHRKSSCGGKEKALNVTMLQYVLKNNTMQSSKQSRCPTSICGTS